MNKVFLVSVIWILFVISTLSSSSASAPAVNSANLNATPEGNGKTGDLNLAITGSGYFEIIDWMVNDKSIAILNMPFQLNRSLTVKDFSTYQNNGTASGTLWTKRGYFGGAYIFDESNINVPFKSSLDLRGAFSIETWVKANSHSGLENKHIVSHSYQVGQNWFGYALFLSPTTGKVVFGTYNGSQGGSHALSNLSIVDGRWHHVVASFNGKSSAVYIDGVLKGRSKAVYPNYSGEQPLIIGASITGDYFSGLIDEVRIYNRSFTPADVHKKFLKWLNGRSSLVLDMQFKENGVISDEFGNSGTLGRGIPALTPIWYGLGKIDGSYSFDGINDIIEINDNPSLSPANEITIIAWVKDPPIAGPKFAFVNSTPSKVSPGDDMVINARVLDIAGINEVYATMPHEKGYDRLDLVLASGTAKDGIWRGVWRVHDTTNRDYTTVVFAMNSERIMSKDEVVWSDWSDSGGGDHGGLDWTPANGAVICGNHYNLKNFTIAAGTTVNTCAGTALEIHANNANIFGILNADARGFAGGVGTRCTQTPGTGTGPGAGGGITATDDGGCGPGGGGGGYGGAGGRGGAADGTTSYGTGGSANGVYDDRSISMGSGGGGARGSCYSSNSGTGGSGGAGGGSIKIIAGKITVYGTLTANGGVGGTPISSTGCSSTYYCGGGGGGSGGSIFLDGNYVNIKSGSVVNANGGKGGAQYPLNGWGGAGGGGGGGRIKIFRNSGGDGSSLYVIKGLNGGNGLSYPIAAAGIDGTTYTGYVCTGNGCPCTLPGNCDSGNCAADYDGGNFCAGASQCVHDNSVYDNGVFAPDCYDTTNRRYCNSGVWQGSLCADTCSGSCPGCLFTDNRCLFGVCSFVSTGDCDAVQQRCDTCKGPGYYSLGGDAAQYSCCGDDPGEYKLTRTCISGCKSNSTDDACCNAETDCVFSSTCYSNGEFYNEMECSAGSWLHPLIVANAHIKSSSESNVTSDNLSLKFEVNRNAFNVTDWRLDGKSIAVLNMPFQTNHSASGLVRDFSTFENNGTVNGAVWDEEGGINGGGYSFAQGSITVPNSEEFDFPEGMTIEAWVKLSQTNVKKIDGGYYSGCFITGLNKAFCWGQNTYGQIGDGTTTIKYSPTEVSGSYEFTDICSEFSHSCGILKDGSARCWGANSLGQLGDGSTTQRLTPTIVSGGYVFSNISCGAGSTCGRLTDNSVRCWGYNSYGQLGTGNTQNVNVPTLVSGGYLFKKIILGSGGHTCGILSDNSLRCWGFNNMGQLGDGTVVNKNVPTAVSGSYTFSSVGIGNYHTCGVKETGEALCWGQNTNGEIGDGTTAAKSVPTQISGAFLFRNIDSGGSFTCGILQNSSGKCWGLNTQGQLGDGTTAYRLTPVSVLTETNFSQIATGYEFSLGITDKGALLSWGDNQYGQLGIGTAEQYLSPKMFLSGYPFISFGVGRNHYCGVLANGTAYCFGLNSNGQLGDGTSISRLSPTRVSGNHNFSKIVLGEAHTCALEHNKSVYCWGRGVYGELGNGATTKKETPTKVAGGIIFSDIGASVSYTCGIAENGNGYCWGDNTRGQLGDGTTATKYVPTPISGNHIFTMLKPGSTHTCGIDTDQNAFCWGSNNDGELGCGTNVNSAFPLLVSGGYNFVHIDASNRFSCGIINTGEAKCWGDNSIYQLGDNTNVDKNVPNPVSGGLSFSAISTGKDMSSCGITSGGAIYCWGYNSNGQCGYGGTSNCKIPQQVASSEIFVSVNTYFRTSCAMSQGKMYCWGIDILEAIRAGQVGLAKNVRGGIIAGKSQESFALSTEIGKNQILGYINSIPLTADVDNLWHHVAMTHSPSGLARLFIDGELSIAAMVGSQILTDNSDLQIGNEINGSIDEIKVFNRSLSLAQIKAEYLAGMDGDSPKLISQDETKKHDQWQAAVWASDGITLSEIAISNILAVRNSVPSLTGVTLNSTAYFTDTNIKASTRYSDADSDIGTVIFTWRKNGEIIHTDTFSGVINGSIVSAVLNNRNYSKNNEINASAYAGDGDESSVLASDKTIILNSLPTVPIQRSPQNRTRQIGPVVRLNCSGSTDKDMDTIHYKFYGSTSDPVFLGSSAGGFFDWDVIAGEKYYWNCQADDLEGASQKTGNMWFTVNRRPAAGSVIISSTDRHNGTDGNLTLAFSVSDGDSDKVYNSTDWRQSGKSIAVLNLPFQVNSATKTGDISTYENNGTVFGAAWTSSGKNGGAYSFDGNDYIWFGDTNSLDINTNDFSISLWAKTTLSSGYLVNKGTSSTNRYYLGLLPNVETRLSNSLGAFAALNSGSQINDGNWHNIVVTYDRSGLAIIYVDGIKKKNATISGVAGIINDANPLIIGADESASSGFSGTIDEVRIYNRSISAGQIMSNYMAELSGKAITRIVSPELRENENWTSAVFASDSYQMSHISVSNIFHIIPNARPFPASIPSPSDGAANVSLSPTLEVFVADREGGRMNVSFHYSSGTLITRFLNVNNGSRVQASLVSLPLKTNFLWYVNSSESRSGTTKSPVWGFETLGYRVVSLPIGITATLLNETSDLSAGYFYKAKPALLKKSGFKIANFTLNFSHNIRLDSLTSDANGRASLVRVPTHPDITSPITLWVPARNNSGMVFICPQATILQQVNYTCDQGYLVTGLVSKNGNYQILMNNIGGVEYSYSKSIISKEGAYSLGMNSDGSSLIGMAGKNITANVISPTTWHQFALTFNGSIIRLFIDGIEASSTEYIGDLTRNTNKIIIGNHFSGFIDDVKIFNESLDAEEIYRNYREGLRRVFYVISGDTTINGENWSARVWEASSAQLSAPADSEAVEINRECNAKGCGIGYCMKEEYGVFAQNEKCRFSCLDSSENRTACENCGGFRWSNESATCCGDKGILDNFCSINSDSCVAGTWFKSHCTDRVTNCDEKDIDCNSTSCLKCGIYVTVLPPKKTKYLKAPQSEVIQWTAIGLGSKDLNMPMRLTVSQKANSKIVASSISDFTLQYANLKLNTTKRRDRQFNE